MFLAALTHVGGGSSLPPWLWTNRLCPLPCGWKMAPSPESTHQGPPSDLRLPCLLHCSVSTVTPSLQILQKLNGLFMGNKRLNISLPLLLSVCRVSKALDYSMWENFYFCFLISLFLLVWFLVLKALNGSWRNGLADKSIGRSCRGLGINVLHPRGGPRPSITPVAGDLISDSGLWEN